jgi:hypothetical protein
MAQIQRRVKTYGAYDFAGEVAAAPDNQAIILSNEVDADFNIIYDAWNAGTDATNVGDNTITGAKLVVGAITTRELLDLGIQTGDIANDAITTVKILNGNVTDAKIANVSWSKVTGTPATYPPGGSAGGSLAGTYPNPSLAANSVGAAQIVDLSVGTNEIANSAVTKLKISPGNSLFNPPQNAPLDGGPQNVYAPVGETNLITINYTPRSYMYALGFMTGVAYSTASANSRLDGYMRDGSNAQVGHSFLNFNLQVNQVVPWTLVFFGNILGSGPFRLNYALSGSSTYFNFDHANMALFEPA